MASVSRRGRAHASGGARRYVASLIWPGQPSRPANDNSGGARQYRLLWLGISAALLAAALWAVLS